jgi:glutathione S-transferase
MPMTLYNSDLSPYAARIRMQVRAKGLEREIVITGKPEGDAYKAISFTGKVPCLDTGMDYALVESDTIAEFIEDAFPAASLRGATPLATARIRLVPRVVDTYFVPGFSALLGQLNPKTRDAAKVADGLAQVDTSLAYLARIIDGPEYALEGRLTLADCALAPALFFARFVQSAMGVEPFRGVPSIAAYFEFMSTREPIGSPTIAEMGAALAAVQRR